MNKIIKYAIITILSVTLIYWLCIIFGGLYLGGIFPLAPNNKQMERCFSENINELLYVEAGLSKIQYKDISMHKSDASNTMYATNPDSRLGSIGGNIPITDVMLVENINKLYKRGFNSISKHNGVYIEFSTWAALNESRGIVYSIDGTEPNFEFIVEIKPLLGKNWYYYESNFEKWKKRNPQKS